MFVKTALLSFFLGSLFWFGPSAWAQNPPKYPALTHWQGQAWVTGKEGVRRLIKSRHVLREKALLETALSSEVRIQMDAKRTLTILGNSELSLPVISWETGEAPVVMLKSGSFRWLQKDKTKSDYNIALTSDLFQFISPDGEYVFIMEPNKAYAGVKVIQGAMEFSALNGEESVNVKTGQQAGFQGVIEGGEIAYDVLLKGRKIPRGRLTEVVQIDKKELHRVADEARKKKQAEQEEIARKEAAKARASKEGRICSRPAGKFNECVWTCINNPKGEKKNCLVQRAGTTCVRQRCNANGQWAEETVLSAEKASIMCKAEPVVAACDY